ncbi:MULTISPECIES: phosphonate C-P lyase system protein PhnH [Gordonia]|jgi:alpha-D-ribose 1-methylphosphonate 5-triphosphate synthase subunit PhnH|uniref:Carbon-phosphorus lyase n=1 Tax=Gordonia alkanivorans CGMCC 6845 TaxID=1423140 RepID=W9DDY6_9ACTN|nr:MULTISPECIES: phosphonate C-P lyase system protein PhnH [Gordonia]ETA06604.1 hypothetical protein V525_12470 [Gordonia alkanivorans CGMCC 6845]MDH3008066.1 phosphonate C-P lyase system protein PhnH [Gordonia alkanivorans]MDH3011713.1 phosphonate C-P lyase system protein PhnH [Gordonia alkanivorans]MDH3016875.1 phosphonate C-P lyase system protein PhnH [Gordonia alkanivorans]MDH3020931.1 phosphonate C-P lyase system protein PhnH [Gordonia alkanivorans]
MTTTVPTETNDTLVPAPGFDDPTRAAQATFRAVLEALSNPGRRCAVAGAPAAPQPLGPGLGAVALTLLDVDCTAWLAPELSATPAVRAWLTFHTGVRVVDDPTSAHFVIAADVASLPPLDTLAVGTDEAPHQSATVLLASPVEDRTARFVGRGPGIETTQAVELPGAWRDFAQMWHRNTAVFPRGVDLVLVADDHLVGLPRTTRLDPQEI